MKDFIVKVFKEMLDLDVRVLNLPDDDIDMGIFIVYDKKIRKMQESVLAEFAPDFAITRVGEQPNQWLYMIGFNIDAVIRNGEVESPPDFDYRESVLTYKTSELALRELVVEIIKDMFNDMLMCREEMSEV